jgi:hypothetical protein
MRIAFISANREKMPDAAIPIGLLQVMAAVPERHEKLFWDLCFEDDPLATVARNLREHAPDLVAIGLRNIQNMDYTNITVNFDYYRSRRSARTTGSPARASGPLHDYSRNSSDRSGRSKTSSACSTGWTARC